MKRLDLKKILCVTTMSLMPLLAFAGGTNTGDTSSTGYQNDPDKATRQGEMGSTDNAKSKGSQSSIKVDDATLNKQVQDALKADAMLNKVDIHVETHGGVVTLSGDAKDVRWKGEASKVANSIPGVKSVQNNLTVGNEKGEKSKPKAPSATNKGDSSQY